MSGASSLTPTSTRSAAPDTGGNVTYPSYPTGPRRRRPSPTASAAPRSGGRLPPGMRAAVVLRHWLDLSVGETADLMNCSEGTVKSQTAKAAARLRELLSPAVAERTYP